MRVTERDVEMMKWINGFGFVMGDQVASWMGVCERVGNRRLRKLERAGLLMRERMFWRGGAVVRLTSDGVRMAGDEVGILKTVKLGTFEHDRQLVDLSLKIEAENEGSFFVPERRIRHELGLKGVGQQGHVPDGFLVLKNGAKIAVELELTRKQKFRLSKIIRGFQSNLKLKEVWYFCAPNVVGLLSEMTRGDEFFRIQEWEA